MKKKIFKFIRKQWLLVWTLMVAAALFTMIVSAEYPGTKNYMKRVVISDDSTDMMFSSNLLTLIENDKPSYQPYYVKKIDEASDINSYDVEVFVWNYDIDGSGDFYKRDITYDLEIKIVDNQNNVISGSALNGGKSIKIFKNDGSTAFAMFNQNSSSFVYNSPAGDPEKIATGERQQNKYTVKFSSEWDLTNDTNIRVQIKATPTSEFSDLKPLAAAIGLREEKSASSSGWEFYINERLLASQSLPSTYDGYNLVLTGTGSASLVIEWDPSKVVINKDFFESGGAFSFISGEVTYTPGTSGSWDRLVIEANSYDEAREYRNRYDLQLYKKNGELGDSWDFIGQERGSGVYVIVSGADPATISNNG